MLESRHNSTVHRLASLLLLAVLSLATGCAFIMDPILEKSRRCRKASDPDSGVFSLLSQSLKERERVGLKWEGQVPKHPSSLYTHFCGLDSTLKKLEAKGCSSYRKKNFNGYGIDTSFEKELKFQQERERAREVALKKQDLEEEKQAQERAEEQEKWKLEEEKQAQERAEEYENWKQEINEKAKKHGYKGVMFDFGLTRAIKDLVKYADVPIKKMKRLAIELDDELDPKFKALQVLGPNKSIYTSPEVEQVVMLKNLGRVVLEGSSLTTIKGEFVVIKGLTSYQTILGKRQAIVIEVAW